MIDSQANLVVQDSQGTTVIQTTLTPVADTNYLYGSTGQLSDPCYGLFTFRITTATSQQDVFVTFVDGAVLFASFTWPSQGGASANLRTARRASRVRPNSSSQQANYDYLYGVGLK